MKDLYFVEILKFVLNFLWALSMCVVDLYRGVSTFVMELYFVVLRRFLMDMLVSEIFFIFVLYGLNKNS